MSDVEILSRVSRSPKACDEALRRIGIMDDRETTLTCPICDWEYTHCEGAGTLLGNDPGEAEVYAGTELIGKVEDERRSALVIFFHCEVGHRWKVVYQQHKGITTVTTSGNGKMTDEMVQARNR